MKRSTPSPSFFVEVHPHAVCSLPTAAVASSCFSCKDEHPICEPNSNPRMGPRDELLPACRRAPRRCGIPTAAARLDEELRNREPAIDDAVGLNSKL